MAQMIRKIYLMGMTPSENYMTAKERLVRFQTQSKVLQPKMGALYCSQESSLYLLIKITLV